MRGAFFGYFETSGSKCWVCDHEWLAQFSVEVDKDYRIVSYPKQLECPKCGVVAGESSFSKGNIYGV